VLNDLRYRLRAVFRRNTIEQELDAELRFHLDGQRDKGLGIGFGAHVSGKCHRCPTVGLDFVHEARELGFAPSLDPAALAKRMVEADFARERNVARA